MSDKLPLYWEHDSSSTIGFELTSDGAKMVQEQLEIDIINAELYQSKAASGSYVNEAPWTLDSDARKECWDKIMSIKTELEYLAAIFQNSGVDIKANHVDLVNKSEKIKDELHSLVLTSITNCKQKVPDDFVG